MLRGALIGALAATLSRAVMAQSCPMYATDFASFGGPPDLADGDLRVQWCIAGATVTSSNFCNSGGALKLDASGDDPVVLVATGGAGCTAIEIRFNYAQFAASQTVVKPPRSASSAVSLAERYKSSSVRCCSSGTQMRLKISDGSPKARALP